MKSDVLQNDSQNCTLNDDEQNARITYFCKNDVGRSCLNILFSRLYLHAI